MTEALYSMTEASYVDDFVIQRNNSTNQPEDPNVNQPENPTVLSQDFLHQPVPVPMAEDLDQLVPDENGTVIESRNLPINSLEMPSETTSTIEDADVNSLVSDGKVTETQSKNHSVNCLENPVQTISTFKKIDIDFSEKPFHTPSDIKDTDVHSSGNPLQTPFAIKDTDVNSSEIPVHTACAIEDTDTDTWQNSVETVSAIENLPVDHIVSDTKETTACEDGKLCVCEVSNGVKPQKRKCAGQKLPERKSKRRCSEKLKCENEVTSHKINDRQLKSRHINRELKESYRNLRNRIDKLNADSVLLEKLKNQVIDKRTHCKKRSEKPSQSFMKTKEVSAKGITERLKFSLPDLDSFGEDSISEAPSEENHFTNDLGDIDTVFSARSVSFDTNLDKDECQDSDDDDLPVGLTPIKIEKYFQEKDIVWVKWKGWPYLPAMVTKVYKKKKRLTCLIFAPEDKPEKRWSVSTASGKVWSYFDNEKKEEILKASEDLNPEDKQYFKECMARLDTYLTKKALGQIKDDYAYFSQDDVSDGELVESEGEEKQPEVPPEEDSHKTDEDDGDDESENRPDQAVSEDFGLSKKGELRKEKIRQKTQKLTDFLLSSTCKEYLQNLFLEKIESERHKIFLKGSVKQKARLKHQGYGPIDDEAQIMSVLMTFAAWLKEVNNNPCLNDNAYIMDVWAPEAIAFAYQKFFTYGKKKAWQMFYKGVRRTKEELESERVALMKQIRNMSPEEKQHMQERHEEILRSAGIEPMRLDFNLKNLR